MNAALPRIVVELGDGEIERIAAAVAAILSAKSDRPPITEADRLTVREAASALRCCDSQVRKLVASGRLRAEKIASGGSSRVFIRRGEIDRLLSESSL